jgi:hypothetical protein
MSDMKSCAASLMKVDGDVEKVSRKGDQFLKSLSAVLGFCVDDADIILVTFLIMEKKLRGIHPMF